MKKMNKSKSVCVFAAFAVGAWVGVRPLAVEAATIERSISALDCSVAGQSDQWGNASLYNPTTSTMYVGCAVQNDSDLWHTNVDQTGGSIRVRGYQWTANHVSAYACYSTFGAVGGACSAAATYSTAGYYDITPSYSTWANSSNLNFPYVVIWLGACSWPSGECSAWDSIDGVYWKGTQNQP